MSNRVLRQQSSSRLENQVLTQGSNRYAVELYRSTALLIARAERDEDPRDLCLTPDLTERISPSLVDCVSAAAPAAL
jgi:hypothetical protein